MNNQNSPSHNLSRNNSAGMPVFALAASLLLLAGALSAQASSPATQVKNATPASAGTPLSSGTLWVSGTAPGTGDIAQWSSVATATADTLTTLGGPFSIGELQIAGGINSPLTAVSLTDATAADTLTLNAVNGVGIDLSQASQTLTLAVPVVINANQT